MHDTRLDLGVLPGGARKSERGHAYVPVQWLRRRKFLIGGVFLIAVVLTYLNAFGHVQRMHPWAQPAVDAEIAHLLRTVPGALPGRVTSGESDPLADDGHHGAAYPSRSDLTLVLLAQLQEPHFQPHDSVWATWQEWLQEGAEVPSDMHIQFLTELKRMDNGTADARLVRFPSHTVPRAPPALGRKAPRPHAIHRLLQVVLPVLEACQGAARLVRRQVRQVRGGSRTYVALLTQTTATFLHRCCGTSRGTARTPRCSKAHTS